MVICSGLLPGKVSRGSSTGQPFPGALLGEKREQAFFVKCDRTTMTQNDLDSGRLVCVIGVAPLTPAEFVIFPIGSGPQTTNDRFRGQTSRRFLNAGERDQPLCNRPI